MRTVNFENSLTEASNLESNSKSGAELTDTCKFHEYYLFFSGTNAGNKLSRIFHAHKELEPDDSRKA